jgi:cysteine-rich repeat protein
MVVTNVGTMGGTATVKITIHDPVCGNGVTETRAGEQCDDGNTMSGDGCSATCQIEPRGMVMGPPGMSTFTGALAAGQTDSYRIVMAHEGYITAETGAAMTGMPTLGMCAVGTDTVIDLVDSHFATLGTEDDISSTNRCSDFTAGTMGSHVQAGTYWLRVHSYSSMAVIPAYNLQIKLLIVGCGNGIVEPGEQCDPPGPSCSATCQFTGAVVNEVEPNNDYMHATHVSVTRGGMTEVHGAISPLMDVDFWSFDITGANASIYARTHSLVGDPLSCDMMTDTELELYNASGAAMMVPLAVNDDINTAGGNFCSMIDMTTTGTTATNLPAGRYYLRVHHFDDGAVIPTYYMDIKVQ